MDKQLQFIQEKIRYTHPTKQWEWDCRCGMTHDRDYTLADVLLAIGKKNVSGFYINRFGQIEARGEDNGGITWNLIEDSLTDQSPETISFIANLLK